MICSTRTLHSSPSNQGGFEATTYDFEASKLCGSKFSPCDKISALIPFWVRFLAARRAEVWFGSTRIEFHLNNLCAVEMGYTITHTHWQKTCLYNKEWISGFLRVSRDQKTVVSETLTFFYRWVGIELLWFFDVIKLSRSNSNGTHTVEKKLRLWAANRFFMFN